MGKSKNKRRRNKHNKYPISRIVGYTIVILFFVAFVVKASYETYINHILKKQGICTQAIVYDRYKVGRKGVRIASCYQFVWKGVTHYGKSEYDTKTKGKSFFNDEFIIGDTITIVLLEDRPEIHRSNSLIKKDCGCTHK